MSLRSGLCAGPSSSSFSTCFSTYFRALEFSELERYEKTQLVYTEKKILCFVDASVLHLKIIKNIDDSSGTWATLKFCPIEKCLESVYPSRINITSAS